MYGYIYKTINLINNKIYIGQHKSKKFNLSYIGSGKLLHEAIEKYGRENFKVELLEKCNSKEELDQKEIKYIELYNSRDLNIGYNIAIGGQKRFFTGQKHSKESKLKMSYKAKNRYHPPVTKNHIWITNGKENHCIKEKDLEFWKDKGFYRGRTVNLIAWNKGLTKDTDDRVKKYVDTRNKKFKNGESIGCYGLKGNQYGFKKGQIPWNKGKHMTVQELSLQLKEKK